MVKDVNMEQDVTYVTPQTTKKEREALFKTLCRKYKIDIGEYISLRAITITVGGATFCETTDVFPSQALINNISLAIQTGNVEKIKSN